MKYFEIKLEGGEDEVIHLNKLPKEKLQEMLEVALEFENYEMCSLLKKYIDLQIIIEERDRKLNIIIDGMDLISIVQ